MERSQNPYSHIKAYIAEAAPKMRFCDGKAELDTHLTLLRAKLTELLGLDLIKAPKEQLFEVEYIKEENGCTEIRFTFQSEEGYFVPCVLRIPNGIEKPPLMICLQGHSTGMHISLGQPKFDGDAETISGGDRDFCVRAVKEGYAALAIEQRCFGECGGTAKGPDCKDTAMDMLLIGRTLVGARVWDVSRAIDVIIAHFPQIDNNRIICMGNSGGGTTTFYSACMDKRISLAMPSCAFCTYDASIAAMTHCACNYIPSARRWFDMGDLAALIAPRKLLVVCGKDDPIFPLEGVKEAYAEAKRMYTIMDAENSIKLVIGDGAHRFYADISYKALKTESFF